MRNSNRMEAHNVRKITRFLVTTVAALALLFAVPGLASPVSAAPDVGDNCTKIKGTIHCTETAGNAPESSNAQRVETGKKGSFQSSHEEQCVSGPPGQCK
jgi:hypothetical protein